MVCGIYSRAKLENMEYPPTQATRHTLPNGLNLILDPDPSAPVVSVQAWIATGSIHEGEKLGSGLSHFLEHMVFKGTRDFSADELARTVQAGGGHWNAYTTFDRTVYYIDGPSASLESFLKCLTGLVFFPTIPEAEFESEKDVIRREIDMGLDDPDNASTRLLLSTAFTVDARRHPVIGHRHLFDEISHPDLVSYHAAATPRTAPTSSSRATSIRKTPPPLSPPSPRTAASSPARSHTSSGTPASSAPRQGFDTFDVPTSRICLSWKTPAIGDPDIPAYEILAAILGRGRSARLYRALRERSELALEISAWTWNGPDETGLFAISAETPPEKRDALKAAIIGELNDLPASSLDDEIARAKRQIAASQFRQLTSASGRASDLASNWHEARDLDFTRAYLHEINTVTAADVRRVCSLLTENRLTFTSLDPEGRAPTAAARKTAKTRPAITTHTLSNGLRLALLPDHRVPVIHFQAAAAAGLPSETSSNNGLNQLLASTFTKGTRSRSAEEIALGMESLGASVSASAGNNALLLQAAGLAEDAPDILEMFADILIHPTFPQDGVEREKASQTAALHEALADPLHTCVSKLRHSRFAGKGYGLDLLGNLETLEKLGSPDLAAHHARHFNATNLTLAVAGDFDPARMIERIETHLGKLPPGKPWIPPQSAIADGCSVETRLPKKQAILAIGYPGSDVSGPHRHSLAFLNAHASDMAGPLFGRIREELGLAYRVGAGQFLGYDTGMFFFYLATSPQQFDLARSELTKEIEKIATDGIPDDVFESVRSTALSEVAIQQQSPSSNARHAALDLLFGHPADSHRMLPEIYANLTPRQIRETARTIFASEATVSIVRPEPE